MADSPYGAMLSGPPMTELAKHTAKNMHVTDGSRTAQTGLFAQGQICQIDVQNHEDDTENGLIVANPTVAFNTELAVIGGLGSDKPNNFAEGSTTNRKGGVIPIVRGSKRICYALVKAVGSDIVAGVTMLVPNSAATRAYTELRNAATSAYADQIPLVAASGACRPFAVCLEIVTTAETSSVAKLVKIQLL